MARQTLYKRPYPQTEPWPPLEPTGGPFSDEPPRDVFRTSCAGIAGGLQKEGFKYLKSKQVCSRQHFGFINQIRFQTSHYNYAGLHVQLWMHATVSSTRLQTWLAERLPANTATDHVAGGMVHLLGDRFSLVQWELADPQDRHATIADALAFIHEEVLPYFALFENPASLIQRLSTKTLPGLSLLTSVELAYCYGGLDQAQAVLAQWIREHPNLQTAISQARTKCANHEPARTGLFAEQVLFLETQYGLSATV